MAFVPVPKDLNRVKTKVMFNLTKRQLICFSIAAAVGVPIFFLAKAHLDLSTAAMLMVVIMLPFIFFALYEKDGQPAEKYLYHIVQSMFIRDKVRPYRTNNLYAEIQQKIKEQASVEMYENILKNEGESSDIYYNLGNSYYKMNTPAGGADGSAGGPARSAACLRWSRHGCGRSRG